MNAPLAAQTGISTTLYMQPSIDWRNHAIERFMAHFVEAATNATPGYLEFFPQMLEWTLPSTQDAVSAIALAHLANISGNQQLQRNSKIH